MSTESVFDIAKALATLPGSPRYGAGTAGSGGFSDGGFYGTGGSGGSAGEIPSPPETPKGFQFQFTSPPSAPTVSVLARAANYNPTAAVLQWANPPAALVPEYGEPHEPGDLPDATDSPPPLDYPSMLQVDTSGDAGFQFEAKPVIQIGTRPTLINPALDAFEIEPVEPYSDPLPEYEPIQSTLLADPLKLDYAADQGLIDRLKTSLSGVDVLATAIQEAIYHSATRDIDREQMQAVQAVMSLAASRGFSMPLGAVNAQVAEVAHDIRTKRNAASSQVRDETLKRAMDVLLEATAQSIAHEAKRFEIHISYSKKLVQTLEFNLRAARETFDAAVTLFNQKLDLVKSIAKNYREYVRAVESQDAAVVADVRLELEKATTYRAEVSMFEAQIGTAAAIADVESTDVKQQALILSEYESYLTGALANVGIVRENLESFRTAIGAFAKALDTDTQKFDAYAEQIRAVGSIPGVWEANVSAYAGFWRAESDRVGTYGAFVQEAGRKLDAEAGEFQRYASAHRSWLQAEASKIQSQTSIIGTFNRAIRAGTGYGSAFNRAEAQYTAAQNMRGLTVAANSMNRQSLDANQEAFDARMKANRLATDATISSGLASTALGVTSVSLGVAGSVGTGKRASRDASTTVSKSARRSWSDGRSHGE